MITDNLKILSFICVVIVTLQTGHTIQENCTKFDTQKTCRDNGVQFYLIHETYGINPGTTREELDGNNPNSIEKARFIDKMALKFIIHGHNQNIDHFMVTPLQREYTDRYCNVVMMNYTKLSNDGEKNRCYRTGVENSPYISKCAAKVIEAIIAHNRAEITIHHFHLIALDLGAQIAGQIPHWMDPKYGTLPGITGIDPANDGFFGDYGTDRYTLTSNDATLVTVIHSNAGIYGKFTQMGHIDWYPNGGTFQPQCPTGNYMCDRMSSLIYFVESIDTKFFIIHAQWCPNLETKILKPDSCDEITQVPFGDPVNPADFSRRNIKKGVYFFETRDIPPYIEGGAYKKSFAVYDLHRKKSD